jgi:hypothetical protein
MDGNFIPEIKEEYIYSPNEDLKMYFIASIYRYWTLIYWEQSELDYEMAESQIKGNLEPFSNTEFMVKISIPFFIIAKNIDDDDIIRLEKYIRKDLSVDFKYIFKGLNGYYLFYADSINTVSVLNGEDSIKMDLTIRYKKFITADNAISFVSENKCTDMYKDYKKTCTDVWDIQKDPSLTESEIHDILMAIDDCLTGRKQVYNDCQRFHDEKHRGAIIRLEKIKDYYHNLLEYRFQERLNFICPDLVELPQNLRGISVSSLRNYINICKDCITKLFYKKSGLSEKDYNDMLEYINYKLEFYKRKLLSM